MLGKKRKRDKCREVVPNEQTQRDQGKERGGGGGCKITRETISRVLIANR